jgi:hypothetical protein
MKVKAMNEWSCALACVTSFLNHTGDPIQQQDIVGRFSSHFPEWHFRQGLLTQAGVLTLFELFDIYVAYILLTDDKKEFLDAFGKFAPQQRYLASFLFTTDPTAHCRRFTALDRAFAEVMDPADGDLKRLTWEDIKAGIPKFLLVCR